MGDVTLFQMSLKNYLHPEKKKKLNP
jgi:hypothetical protein